MVPFYACAATGTDYDGSYVVPFVERPDSVKRDDQTVRLANRYSLIKNLAMPNHTCKARTIMNIPKD